MNIYLFQIKKLSIKFNCQECNLLSSKNFLPLFITQFCGAFNDNLFKLSILTLISYQLSTSQVQSEHYQLIANFLYIVPFFLFSAIAGQLSDRYDKALIIQIIKCCELILMIFGIIAIVQHSIFLMFIVLTGMGLHSTFFSPVKYAILPDLLRRKDLLSATALIESSTFFAILFGNIVGAVANGHNMDHFILGGFMLSFIAIFGLSSSLFIPKILPQVDNVCDLHIWRVTKNMLLNVIHDRIMLIDVLLIAWNWLMGSVLLTKLPDYIHYILQASPAVFALFLTLLAIGIMLGSLTISHILNGRIVLRYVPLAMLLTSVVLLDLYFATKAIPLSLKLISFHDFLFSLKYFHVLCDFLILSFSSGLYIVPLYTYLQANADPKKRSQVIATNNIITAFGMILGSVMIGVMLKLNISIMHVFLLLSLMNIIIAISCVKQLKQH